MAAVGEMRGRGIRHFGYFLIDCNGYMSSCIYSPGRLGLKQSQEILIVIGFSFPNNLNPF
jgi:hypothetical protein